MRMHAVSVTPCLRVGKIQLYYEYPNLSKLFHVLSKPLNVFLGVAFYECFVNSIKVGPQVARDDPPGARTDAMVHHTRWPELIHVNLLQQIVDRRKMEQSFLRENDSGPDKKRAQLLRGKRHRVGQKGAELLWGNSTKQEKDGAEFFGGKRLRTG
ncbi:hypothetical protein T11_7961 [Trichinella zimbabwensis]|uniref:Uncharacterized protein n=1 Tax=Trichinella zimbabwensis TaxID=268475 RepID=A0A0V1HLC1_9BILA|nr:hypothetical protein T11_7961 [Trichinella zimbabwensis]